MTAIRTLIADDEPLARQRLRKLLEAEPDIEVIGECPDGESAVAAVVESGGRTQACSLLAILIIAAIALFAGGLFSFVPEAALAGVLMFIALRICRVDTMRKIYLNGGIEILLVIASAAQRRQPA